MRRAFFLAGGLAMLALGIGCDHYHGVCDCSPVTNSAVCGFYAHAKDCNTPAPLTPTGAPPGISSSAFQPLQQMPKADADTPNKE
jgi:hypothetical protein